MWGGWGPHAARRIVHFMHELWTGGMQAASQVVNGDDESVSISDSLKLNKF